MGRCVVVGCGCVALDDFSRRLLGHNREAVRVRELCTDPYIYTRSTRMADVGHTPASAPTGWMGRASQPAKHIASCNITRTDCTTSTYPPIHLIVPHREEPQRPRHYRLPSHRSPPRPSHCPPPLVQPACSPHRTALHCTAPPVDTTRQLYDRSRHLNLLLSSSPPWIT